MEVELDNEQLVRHTDFSRTRQPSTAKVGQVGRRKNNWTGHVIGGLLVSH